VFFCLVNSCSLYSALKNAASILRNSLCAPNREYTKIREIHIAPLHTDSLSGSCHNASIHQGSLFQDHIGPLKGHSPDNIQHNCHKSIVRLPQSTILWNIQVSVQQIGRVIWQSPDQLDIFALFFVIIDVGQFVERNDPLRCDARIFFNGFKPKKVKMMQKTGPSVLLEAPRLSVESLILPRFPELNLFWPNHNMLK
jgi:hypothetical protein